ncbi:phenolic glucoside malonyltransferase 1-like [Dioscorea cayenensis subsp. rotundata]|uniref:Phenolic glucoside malonyltransferase 1-like n=1 Tax=Dioscorea cayennensis subsp. rotundata TaxID=55577 RepID=A0AB40C414_DIOCR|nr:phenolic glucoside malonyltransferase 1-like [Dioscorea cayenensis subsp. rotundata]
MQTPSSPPLHPIKTLENSTVSPPKGSVPDTSIPLNSFDILWLTYGAVQRLFFFKLPSFSTSHFISHHLPTFKSSLSLTLQHFFPLCGHVRPSSSSPDHYEIHYTDGDSVSLILSESTGDFQELSGHQPKDFKKLHPLIPSLTKESTSLMALQLTGFPNHGGLCLGVSIKHVVSDGTGFINFVKSWAATNLAGVPKFTPPLLHRNIISDSEKLYSVNLEAIRLMEAKLKVFSANVDSPDDELVCATFSLNKEDIKKIKDSIMSKYGSGFAAPFHCSTFVVACAYMWTCLIRSRKWPSERTAHFVFAVDARPRVTPAIPPSYFGNYLGCCFTEVKVGDVMDGDGVHVAAEAIGKAIDELMKHGVLREAEEWPRKLMALSSERPLSIAGSPKLGVYEIDFGWGKPVKVEVTTIKETGAMSMAEIGGGGGGGGGGGIEFGLAFPKHEIDAFQTCFTAGLQLL